MPQKTQSPPQPLHLVDGPPADFSFKSIRNIAEIVKMSAIIRPSELPTEVIKSESFAPKNSEKEIGDGTSEARLNIVRTIELDESRNDMVKQLVSKKTEKVAAKVVRKSETRTASLFLRYNKLRGTEGFVETLQQLLPGQRWQQLVWVDLSHNRLTTVDPEWQALPQLKNLYLHANFISSFKEFQKLQGAKLLRTFTIHGNPVENYPEFRALLTCILPQLQKLDSALLTRREKERGEVLKKQAAKYPAIANPQRPPEESDEEDEA